jgi:hypothetical protein
MGTNRVWWFLGVPNTSMALEFRHALHYMKSTSHQVDTGDSQCRQSPEAQIATA